MNAYYHEFTPNVLAHWYPYLMIVVLVAMVAMGSRQYRVVLYRNRMWRVRVAFTDEVMTRLAIALSAGLSLLATCESYHGIVQYLDNGTMPGESPAWSVLVVPVVTVLLFGLLFEVYAGVAFGVAHLTRKYAHKKIRRMHERRETRRRRIG